MWPINRLNTKSHIIITGASGFLGKKLLAFFFERGHTVTALTRTLPQEKNQNINYVKYDMLSEIDKNISFKDAVIIHTAYTKEEHLPDINLLAAERLLKKAVTETARQCIFISSLSATSGSGSYYAKQKKAVENLFQQASQTCIRPGLIIGNGGLFQQTVDFIQRFGVLPLFNGGKQNVYYIGVEDLAKCMDELISQNKSGCYYALHAEPIPYAAFYKRVANCLNRRVYMIPVPIWILKVISFLPFSKITKDNVKGLNAVPELEKEIVDAHKYSFAFDTLEMLMKKFR
jgi:NAD dependent epimerase/dehydratase family enzyme